MTYDDTGFELSLREQRQYITERSSHCDILLHLSHNGWLSAERRGKYEVSATGSHVMNDGNPLGISQINERFDITLPTDFDAFYRMHDGGYLLFQEIYRLMPVQEIIELALDMQDRVDELSVPWHFIRFCDLREVGHIGLRRQPDGHWCVMFADLGYSLHDLINDEELHRTYTWDDSFSLWLKRVCATDGWTRSGRASHQEAPLLRLR